MENSKDPISVRVARINSEIIGKRVKFDYDTLLTRETLLDILQVLYEECSLESLQKYDTNITKFVEKYKDKIREIKQLRVNISDFEIKNVIGRGRFGEVHLVKERQTGDLYAMKTLRKFDNDINHASYEEERNIMAFAHSNWLTSLQYAFQDDTYLFFIMDYHPGGDLLGLLYRQGGTLPESAATFYIAELILALEDFHRMGYVHRDIKPDNILLDRCGHIKLADFGSAARIDSQGFVITGLPVGTPDYVAPEVLQCLDNNIEKNSGYGVSCDFWSLGILAYELTIGKTPFNAHNTTLTYSKIMNRDNLLTFPSDAVLSQAYVTFVKALITEENKRLNMSQIKKHDLFKDTHFESLKDQVPPFVPKIASLEDTSNFSDIPLRKKNPTIENFKKRTQFSGRNLPFVGFTFTHDVDYDNNYERKCLAKDEIVQNLKAEIEELRKELIKKENSDQQKDVLEKMFNEKSRKLESIVCLRDKLERDLANTMAENATIKRTLELERKDRAELEKKALDLIKGAKMKWEMAEKKKVEALTLEIEQQKEKISQLSTTNSMLNEQLQHVLKSEDKHKQSLEKVKNLNRRSVIGLESRLEKVTIETQDTISDMQKKLTEEIHQKAILEGKLKLAKNREDALLNKLSQSEKDFNSWKQKIEEAEMVIKDLNEQITVLETKVDKLTEYEEEIGNLQEIIDSNSKVSKDLENRNTFLQMETKMMNEYKDQIKEMKQLMSQLQEDNKKIMQLENQLQDEREKCAGLEKQIQESQNNPNETQELKELRVKYWKMEKDFSNCKIDKRILERELKDANNELKQLKETIENFNKASDEARKIHETALLEMSSINETITMDLIKFKDLNKNLQDKLNSEKEKSAADKIIVNELKEIVKKKDDQLNELQKSIGSTKNAKASLEEEIKKHEMDKDQLVKVIQNLQREKSELFDELGKVKREMQNTNMNSNALREACSLLENQVIEYEKIISNFEHKQSELNSNTEKLIHDLCNAKQDIQEARKLTNQEKSLKIAAETKVKRLQDEIETLKIEIKSCDEQCSEYKRYTKDLSEELSVAEEKITDLEVTLKSYQRQIDDLRTEVRIVKQENTSYLTQLGEIKEINYKLKQKNSELKDERISVLQRMSELERVLNEKSHFYKERETKSEATIKQQIKLIDYLQSKIDEQNNKKRTLAEVLFGSSRKENQPPLALPMNYKELETQLLKERLNNKQLREEIYKLKAEMTSAENNKLSDKLNKIERHKSEILSPKSKLAMQQIVNSPSKQKSDFYRQNSVQRMHHNIPHRFESKMCSKSSTCMLCSEALSIGRTVSICTECNLNVHVYCSKNAPNTCGLPQVLAKHYTDSLKKTKGETQIIPLGDGDVINVEGWIKVPTKTNGWEKRYACLTDEVMNIYTDMPSAKDSKLLQTFPLKPSNSHGKVIMEPVPSEIGIPVANSDLPFILKIEVAPDTTCWPPKCLIFMSLTAQDKDKWFLALQKIYQDDSSNQKFDHLFKIPPDLEVTSVTDLTENIKVLSTEKGLYSFYENSLLLIEGMQKVHQISVMKSTNTVFMIINEKRELIACDLNHLINLTQCAKCSKPKLNYSEVRISNLNGFHLVQTSPFENQQKVCAATPKQLVILNYHLDTNNFVPVRILDSAEPTSCILFTENSLIVGTDKFFEIDLSTFEAEEFLDFSDVRLKQAERCHKMGSFPVAILQVSKNPREYILCFNEFSVFVDEYGRSTRTSEIKSTHLPIAFHFIKPYLYIIQFAALEMIKITEYACNGNSADSVDNLERTRIELGKFKYLGFNKKGIYLTIDNEVKFVDAKKIVDGDLSSLFSESTETESDRFSFSSSMMQSLDGDIESQEDKQKRVRFSRTDL